MGQAVAVRTDYTAGEVRRFAKRAKDAARARRLLAIAAVLDGASREDAAKIGGMDRQTLRDWVIRFNEQGPDGLINIPSPGVPPKLDDTHRAFLARLVEEGPIPAVHGVVRWRACDLIMRLYEEFTLSVSDDTSLAILSLIQLTPTPRLMVRPPERLAVTYAGQDGYRPSLVSVPAFMFGAGLRAIGQWETYERLTGSLIADASALARLGWVPPVNTAAGLAALVQN